MNKSKPASKSNQPCCEYCGRFMLDNSLSLHRKEVHNKPKLVKGQTTLCFAGVSGAARDKEENKSKSESPPPVSDDESLNLPDPGVENRVENSPQKRARTEFFKAPLSSTENTNNTTTTSHSVAVEEKLDLRLSQLSNLNSKKLHPPLQCQPSQPYRHHNPKEHLLMIWRKNYNSGKP